MLPPDINGQTGSADGQGKIFMISDNENCSTELAQAVAHLFILKGSIHSNMPNTGASWDTERMAKVLRRKFPEYPDLTGTDVLKIYNSTMNPKALTTFYADITRWDPLWYEYDALDKQS